MQPFTACSLSLVLLCVVMLDLSAQAQSKSDKPLLAPGIISTDAVEFGAVFSPDNKEVFFTRGSGDWGSSEQNYHIYVARGTGNGTWTSPKRLFDGSYQTGDPFLSPDGSRLFFTSDRPYPGKPGQGDDIWVMDRVDGEWQDPYPLINLATETLENSPVLAADGSLYFSSMRSGGYGQGDFWRAEPDGHGGFRTPENLGAGINDKSGEWTLMLGPNDAYMIFEASGRPGALSNSGDLYITYRKGNEWTPATALVALNTQGSDLMPRLSPDGKHLYYTSTFVLNGRQSDIVSVNIASVVRSGASPGPRLGVVSRSGHELVTVDPSEMIVAERFPTGKGPHEAAYLRERNYVFLPDYGVFPRPHNEPVTGGTPPFQFADTNTLTRIHLPSGDIEKIKICERSHGITSSGIADRLWVSCQNIEQVWEINPDTDSIEKQWDLGVKGNHTLTVTEDGRYVVAANIEDGSISIIDRQQGEVTTIETGKGAEGLDLSANEKEIWVGNAQASTVSVIDFQSRSIIVTFPSEGNFPVKVAITPDNSEVWVVNTFSRSVAIFDRASRQLKDNLTFDTAPLGILITPDGDTVFLSFPRFNQVRRFERTSRTETGRVDGIIEADGMTWID